MAETRKLWRVGLHCHYLGGLAVVTADDVDHAFRLMEEMAERENLHAQAKDGKRAFTKEDIEPLGPVDCGAAYLLWKGDY
ncbi:MAG: hypothetical protein M3315_11895 [Actinomycetota bacterium]|nr:hypothetical protein [Actinomycetota bacterium]